MRTTALFTALKRPANSIATADSTPRVSSPAGPRLQTVAGADGINEMAFNNADGQLYAISGAANLMTVDVNTGAVTEIGQFGSGVVAMDFDSNGTPGSLTSTAHFAA